MTKQLQLIENRINYARRLEYRATTARDKAYAMRLAASHYYTLAEYYSEGSEPRRLNLWCADDLCKRAANVERKGDV